MKNIAFAFLTIMVAMFLSSFNYQSNSEKKVTGKDTITVIAKTSVDVKAPQYQKEDNSTLKRIAIATEQLAEQGDSKLELINNALISEKVSNLDNICADLNITQEELVKKARGDTLIKFISVMFVILLVIGGFKIIYSLSIKEINDWKIILIVFITYLVSVVILNENLYYILSYLFNSDYLNYKNLITLIK